MHELNEEIGKLLARAEQLGGEGNVDEAQQVLEKVEKTRALKKEAEVSVGSKVMVEISLWSSVLALDFFVCNITTIKRKNQFYIKKHQSIQI